MRLVCFGTTFREAPVAFRERVVLSAPEAQYGLVRRTGSPFTEIAVLSTCNRTEFYGTLASASETGDDAFEWLATWLESARSVTREAVIDRFYRHAGREAVRHLCRVASGLDSLVIGESEIAGQVSAALDAARAIGAAGPMTEEVFRTAIRAGRRARHETAIARKPASVSSVAVDLAREAANGLGGKHVLLVGTGKMGRLACRALRAQGIASLSVVSRTPAHAEALATAHGGWAGGMDDLPAALATADVLLTSTSAPHVVVTADLVRAARAVRGDDPLVVVDIAVPRDVAPEVGTIPGVRLYDIDDLRGRIDEHLADRRAEVPQVERIIDEEVGDFEQWHERRGTEPLIATLRTRAEAIRRFEVERTLRRLELDDSTREQIDHLSRALVNKLLHEPMRRLRGHDANGDAGRLAGAARDLFGLDEGHRPPARSRQTSNL